MIRRIQNSGMSELLIGVGLLVLIAGAGVILNMSKVSSVRSKAQAIGKQEGFYTNEMVAWRNFWRNDGVSSPTCGTDTTAASGKCNPILSNQYDTGVTGTASTYDPANYEVGQPLNLLATKDFDQAATFIRRYNQSDVVYPLPTNMSYCGTTKFPGDSNVYKACLKKDCGLSAWTFVGGNQLFNQAGVYGTRGVANASNIPGARDGDGNYTSWQDSNGNLWILGAGGMGYDSVGTFGAMNDLWRYDGANWTWMAGTKVASPPSTAPQTTVYGTKGTAAAANTPGSRMRAATWVDSTNRLWLFGGGDHPPPVSGTRKRRNDLWRFDGVNWTWVGGTNTIDNAGSYGTKGTASATNIPKARSSAGVWKDSTGSVWIFGGSPPGNNFGLSDLWKYDGTNWTWIAGPNTTNDQGTYGTKGTASASNNPPNLSNLLTWVDSSNNLWLYGGAKIPSSGIGWVWMDDLWKFNGTSWTWISGSGSGGTSLPSYGTMGVAASSNSPGNRSFSMTWTNNLNHLYLYGGGIGATVPTSSLTQTTDLWKFDGTNWTWLAGENATVSSLRRAVYPPAGCPHAGARFPTGAGTVVNNQFFQFSGYCYHTDGTSGRCQDIWKFTYTGP